MKKIHHISFSSHDEVMCRSEEDLNYLFNCFAVACLETDSAALADAEMTTHAHFGAFCDSPCELFKRIRYPYSRYFNSKYGRKGRLGEYEPFVLCTEGARHTQTLLSYILRQGLHHGLSETPFGYPHSSVNIYFQQSLGKQCESKLLSRNHWYKYLACDEKCLPDKYRMSEGGLLLREDVIDRSFVEEIFITPRNFLYQMNRYSSEEWAEEQNADKNGLSPISLEDIEPKCYRSAIQSLLSNETSRKFSRKLSDIELCQYIDCTILPEMKRTSIYQLSDSERRAVGNRICLDIKSGRISSIVGHSTGLPDIPQIKRCLIIH